MNPHREAVESAKRMLDESEPAALASMGAGDLLDVADRMRRCLEGLIELAEAQPKSARLRLQHDEEFLNLARAARMEIHALKGGLQRLDRFEQALTGMVEPKDGGSDE
ncbi:hypothetical protein [Streptomyces hygroscopicus]|uniref:hypothetical protein n=1 Tax=Streptomyces hygroscopicus TaxID=1912 RepID=UPI0033C06EB5